MLFRLKVEIKETVVRTKKTIQTKQNKGIQFVYTERRKNAKPDNSF